ncbi:hypothetical protein PMIN03_002327 [Paraphaeosphaeria minitans]
MYRRHTRRDISLSAAHRFWGDRSGLPLASSSAPCRNAKATTTREYIPFGYTHVAGLNEVQLLSASGREDLAMTGMSGQSMRNCPSHRDCASVIGAARGSASLHPRPPDSCIGKIAPAALVDICPPCPDVGRPAFFKTKQSPSSNTACPLLLPTLKPLTITEAYGILVNDTDLMDSRGRIQWSRVPSFTAAVVWRNIPRPPFLVQNLDVAKMLVGLLLDTVRKRNGTIECDPTETNNECYLNMREGQSGKQKEQRASAALLGHL